MNVGGNVRRLREAAGISQADLARQTNVSAAMICQIERGTKAMSLQLAMEVAAALKCDVRDLVSDAS